MKINLNVFIESLPWKIKEAKLQFLRKFKKMKISQNNSKIYKIDLDVYSRSRIQSVKYFNLIANEYNCISN